MALQSHSQSFHLARCLLLGLIGLTLSCDRTDPNPISENYFPVGNGQFFIYDVTDNTYAIGQNPIKLTYQIKEKRVMIDEQHYKIERTQRKSASEPWTFHSSGLLSLEGNRWVLSENGNNILLLVLPFAKGESWDRNLLNTEEALIAEVEHIAEPFESSNLTLKIAIEDQESLINKYSNFEIYGKDTGLIYKENIQLDYCQSSPDCIGKGQIDAGTELIWRLQSFGSE